VVRFRSTEASVQFHPAARGLQEVDFPLAILGGKRTSARSVTRKAAGFLIAEGKRSSTNKPRRKTHCRNDHMVAGWPASFLRVHRADRLRPVSKSDGTQTLAPQSGRGCWPLALPCPVSTRTGHPDDRPGLTAVIIENPVSASDKNVITGKAGGWLQPGC
jgi:hypothetical protein